jgi:hypothetical protein
MLWNEEDREGSVSNWHCNCSVSAACNRSMNCEYACKGWILAVLRLKAVLPLKGTNELMAQLDRTDVCR